MFIQFISERLNFAKLIFDKMKDIIILYSGGMDSSVALYKYADRIRLAVSFNYGSKHNEREITYAKRNCKHLSIEHRVIEMDLNKMGFVSDLLTSGGEIPDGHYEDEKNCGAVP